MGVYDYVSCAYLNGFRCRLFFLTQGLFFLRGGPSAAEFVAQQEGFLSQFLSTTGNQFLCPNGEMLSRKGEYEYNGKPVYAYYGANCAECPFRSECAWKGKKRVITSDSYEGERRRMAAKMRSDTGKVEYKKISETVEWIFGNIKQNMKFREFLTRGLESVRTEYNLVCSAHNLKIIWGILSRDAAVIGKILGSVTNLAAKVKNFFRGRTINNLKCHC